MEGDGGHRTGAEYSSTFFQAQSQGYRCQQLQHRQPAKDPGRVPRGPSREPGGAAPVLRAAKARRVLPRKGHPARRVLALGGLGKRRECLYSDGCADPSPQPAGRPVARPAHTVVGRAEGLGSAAQVGKPADPASSVVYKVSPILTPRQSSPDRIKANLDIRVLPGDIMEEIDALGIKEKHRTCRPYW